jgi:hypothetical protein
MMAMTTSSSTNVKALIARRTTIRRRKGREDFSLRRTRSVTSGSPVLLKQSGAVRVAAKPCARQVTMRKDSLVRPAFVPRPSRHPWIDPELPAPPTRALLSDPPDKCTAPPRILILLENSEIQYHVNIFSFCDNRLSVEFSPRD